MTQTFTTWLLQQKDRNDNVGYFARDTFSDDLYPHENVGLRAWKEYLFRCHADTGAFDALDIAWKEYQSSKVIG